MASASGFPCPKCKSHARQAIVGKDIVRLLELKCGGCGFEWAVEAGANGKWMSPSGRVEGLPPAP